MEIDLKKQIPERVALGGIATMARFAPVPVDETFVGALSGKKIREATPAEVLLAVSAAVEKVWFDRQLKPIDEKDFKQIKMNIAKDFISCFGSMTLNEIVNCFHHWCRGKYKKFYSVNVVEASQAMSDYLTDQTRIEAVLSLKPKELPAAKPSQKELFDLAKSCLWIALDKYQTKTALGALAPTVYNFLNELGLMIYTTEEKWNFMAKGLLSAINDLRLSLIKETDEHKISGMKRQLNLLIDANQPGAALKDADCIQLVKNKAKELTLLDWFEHCAESELNIDQMVENKRAAFEKKMITD